MSDVYFRGEGLFKAGDKFERKFEYLLALVE